MEPKEAAGGYAIIIFGINEKNREDREQLEVLASRFFRPAFRLLFRGFGDKQGGCYGGSCAKRHKLITMMGRRNI